VKTGFHANSRNHKNEERKMSPEKKLSKRQMIKQKRKRQQRNNRLIAIGLITLGAVFMAFLLVIPTLRTNAQFSSRPNANDNLMGDPNAPIKITEYSDYRCSHCGTFARETEPLLVEEYIQPGLVLFEYRSMGNWSGEPSQFGIEATYCAGEENMFWEYHDIVFANQGASLDMPNLTTWAGMIGLNEDAFRECMNERRYKERAEQDALDGTALGVEGTPAFYLTYTVDGEEKMRVIPGAQPIESFRREIQAALAEMGLE
jgi:protein-disulfide isomerase